MILVFGGTTEGKLVVEVLQALQQSFVYSTKTEIEFVQNDYASYRFGAFTEQSLAAFIKSNQIKLIVHAAHPFAEVLHTTIANVTAQLRIPVFRLERWYPKRDTYVNYVDSYEMLKHELQLHFTNKRALFLTGVQTIEKLSSFWKENTSYFRILDRSVSKNIAEKSKFPSSNLILGYPNKEIAKEITLFKQLAIDVVVTKESGKSGALSLKIAAAKQVGIPIYVLTKPVLPKEFVLFTSTEALTAAIKKVM